MKVGDVIHGYQILDRLDLGGSDRQFFRCRKNETTFVIIYDREIEAYLRLQRHLRERNINVPSVYWHSLEERIMVQVIYSLVGIQMILMLIQLMVIMLGFLQQVPRR